MTAAPSFEDLLGRPGLAWMGQNTTHLEPPPEVTEALLRSTREREFQLYAPALGFSRLRELIVRDLGLAGADAWVTDGAVGGLHHICTALATDLSRVVTTDPGWPWPGRFAGFSGTPVSTVDVYPAGKATAAGFAEVIEPGSLIYLIDPLNPLGARYDRAELEAIVELARDTRSLIVHDCTYRHFADGHTLVAGLYPEGTFTTYSFSKWLGLAGLRLGAVVARPDLLARLTKVPSNPLGANIQAQRAAIAGLTVKEPWLERVRAANRRNQEIVRHATETSGFGSVLVWPSHGNFVAVEVGPGLAEAVCAAMLEHDVFIRPGTYQSPRSGDRFVKVSTSVPVEWAERFAVAWAKLEVWP
ncbi:pyridoxal phosphate-dependent aminotransferase [Amycolatopsis acidicola]|uniref:Aminotransferase n=1 Tax=Amycolatopsis acidicola TaxID=2596893 RepID=A0A5N0VC17_9PSEU|nr:pyridoxal phosphate-dependent aminotransferase [Amycolatopsis acidicola]KAA9162680.1 pyridoxal phosphate-dependent aminotransferase [Amycolatopsis acidicola]